MSIVNLDSVMDCGDPRRQFPTNFYISYNTEVAEFVLKSIYIGNHGYHVFLVHLYQYHHYYLKFAVSVLD